jgi:hypothetical protein
MISHITRNSIVLSYHSISPSFQIQPRVNVLIDCDRKENDQLFVSPTAGGGIDDDDEEDTANNTALAGSGWQLPLGIAMSLLAKVKDFQLYSFYLSVQK